MPWRKDRPLHPGELEFHLTGMREQHWNPEVIDHPAGEMERRRKEAME